MRSLYSEWTFIIDYNSFDIDTNFYLAIEFAFYVFTIDIAVQPNHLIISTKLAYPLITCSKSVYTCRCFAWIFYYPSMINSFVSTFFSFWPISLINPFNYGSNFAIATLIALDKCFTILNEWISVSITWFDIAWYIRQKYLNFLHVFIHFLV